jgi:two-component system, NarL family, response regulator DesR
MIRLLLVEDKHLGRSGLAAQLAREAGIALIGRLDIEASVVAEAARKRPSVVLVNTDYMVVQILPMLAELTARVRGCAVILLSDPSKRGMLPPRRQAQHLNFVVRGTMAPVIAAAIRRVAGGERVVDARLQLATLTTDKTVSTRELEVLGLAAEGDSVADIARRLFLSLGTVRNHLSSVIAKTGARNRLDAIRIVRKDGWLR